MPFPGPEHVEELEPDTLHRPGNLEPLLVFNPKIKVVLGFPVQIQRLQARQLERVIKPVLTVAVGGRARSVEQTRTVGRSPLPELL